MSRNLVEKRKKMIEGLKKIYKEMKNLSENWEYDIDLSEGYIFSESFDEVVAKMQGFIKTQEKIVEDEEFELVDPKFRKYHKAISTTIEDQLGLEWSEELAIRVLEAISEEDKIR